MRDLICVGAISGAFGVSGEVRLKSFCAEPADIADYSPLTDEGGLRDFAITALRPTKGGFAARLAGVSTRDAAEALRGTSLFADREKLPALPDDEYYHADLIGLEVVDTGGAVLGQVKSVHNHGAADLLEITPVGASEPVLLPFTRAAVPTVDLTSGRLVADPPDGVFE